MGIFQQEKSLPKTTLRHTIPTLELDPFSTQLVFYRPQLCFQDSFIKNSSLFIYKKSKIISATFSQGLENVSVQMNIQVLYLL